jgi:hypothetical protein
MKFARGVVRSVGLAVTTATLLSFASCGWLGNVSIKGKGATQAGTGSGGTDVQRTDPGPVNPSSPQTSPPRLVLFGEPQVQVDDCSFGHVFATNNAQAINVTSGITVSLLAPGAVTFYDSSSCSASNQITSTIIPAGSSSANFYYKASAPSTYTLTATDTSNTYAQATFRILAFGGSIGNQPVSLSLQGSPSVQAGACAAYAVTYKNSSNNPSSFPNATTANLTHIGPGGKFYATAGCGNGEVFSINIQANQSSATFYYRNENSGNNKIQVIANALPAEMDVTVTAGSLYQLTIIGPTNLNTGTCGRYDVESKDQYGNQVFVSSNLAITLHKSGEGNFYSDAGCNSGTNSIGILTGTSVTPFFYQSADVGHVDIAAKSNGLQDGAISIDFANGGNKKLAFNQNSYSTSAGNCFGPLKVQIVDGSGTVISNAPSATVKLSTNLFNSPASQGGATFYTDANCGTSVQVVQTNANVYVRDFQAENLRLQADDLSQGLQSAVADLLVNAGGPVSLSLSANQSQNVAGECFPVFVRYKDTYGNNAKVSRATTVTLTEELLNKGKFYSDNSCASALPGVNAVSGQTIGFAIGDYEKLVYFRETLAGHGILWAKESSVNPGKLDIDIVAGRPHVARYTQKPGSIVVNECSSVFELTLFDQYDNIATADVLYEYALASAGGTFFSNASCGDSILKASFPKGTSQAYFHFKPSVTGTVIGTATPPTPLPPAEFQVQVLPGPAPTHLAILADGGGLNVRKGGDGIVGLCYKFKLRSENGSEQPMPLANTTPISLARFGAGKFYGDSTCAGEISGVSIISGASEATFYYRSTVAQAELLYSKSNLFTVIPYKLSLNAGSLSGMLVAGPAVTIAGACAGPYLIFGLDAFGNQVILNPGTQFSLSQIAGSGNFFSSSDCSGSSVASIQVNNPFQVGIFYVKDTVAEIFKMKVADSANSNRRVEIPLLVKAGAPTHFMLVPSGPLTSQVNVCSGSLSFRQQDAFYNVIVDPLGSRSFELSQSGSVKFYNGSCSSETTSVSIPANAPASESFTYKGSVVEMVDFWIRDLPARMLTQHMKITITSPPAVQANLKVIPPGGTTAVEGPITVQAGQTVKLTWSASASAKECTVTPGNYKGLSSLGQETVQLFQDTMYKLECLGDSGAQNGVDWVDVKVTPAVPCIKQVKSFGARANPATTPLLGVHADLAYKARFPGIDAKAAIRLTGLNVTGGDRLYLKNASGVGIFRIESSGNVIQHEVLPCPQTWYVNFVNANGAILSAYTQTVNSLRSGVVIPAGTVSVYVGARNGSNGEKYYYDNEGGGRTPNTSSTNGCKFDFEVRVPEAQVCQ